MVDMIRVATKGLPLHFIQLFPAVDNMKRGHFFNPYRRGLRCWEGPRRGLDGDWVEMEWPTIQEVKHLSVQNF